MSIGGTYAQNRGISRKVKLYLVTISAEQGD